MRVMKFISLALIVVAISAFAVAQQAPAQTPPTVKHVPITNAPSNSGKEMFNSYCAVCHGKDANLFNTSGEEERRQVPGVARSSGDSRTGHHAITWQCGYASVGPAF